MITVCACCTEYVNFGCFSMCEETLSNAAVLATADGVYSVAYNFGGTVHTIETTAIEGEVLEFANNFPVGITYFIITDTEGDKTCYVVTVQRLPALCPEIIIDEKTLSPC